MNIVDVQNVTWVREGKHLLTNVNWQIDQNQHWALVGLNGSGKTSLLKLIMGYEWPTRGTVEVLGNRFGDCDLQQIRKSIGWVSSALRDQLYPNETANDIVISGKYASIGMWTKPNSDDRDQAYAILERIRCTDLVNKRFGTLSQGEKQKVLLARALMADPKLIILDEPCFGLDLRSREQVLQLVSDLIADDTSIGESATVLLVTHHIEEIMPAISHVALIADGSMVAQGQKNGILTENWIQEAFQVSVKINWEQGRPWIRVV